MTDTPYPLHPAPDTWALDPIFKRSLEEAHVQWAANGFAWKFGLEVEFQILSPEKTRKILKNDASFADTVLAHRYMKQNLDRTESDQNKVRSHALTMIAEIRDSFNGPDAAHKAAHFFKTPAAILRELDDIRAGLESTDPEKNDHALQCAVMAFLHAKPISEGGLFEILEPRFSDEIHGRGWWDNPGVAELRIKPTADPFVFIDRYHLLISQAMQASLAFGMLYCGLGTPHLHFSLWDAVRHKNLMEMADPESIEVCEQTMYGIHRMMSEAPALVQKLEPHKISSHVDTESGGSRMESIRQLNDNWEFRRGFDSGFTHLACDLFTIVGGAAWGRFHADKVDIQQQKEAGHFPIGRISLPVVHQTFGLPMTGLKSTLQNARIEEDGTLHADHMLCRYNQERMNSEIGSHAVSLFQYKYGEDSPTEDLNVGEVWQKLFSSIKLGPDNVLQLAHLHPEIRDVFDAFRVTGRRTLLTVKNPYITGHFMPLTHSLATLRTAPSLMAFTSEQDRQSLYDHYVESLNAIPVAMAAGMAKLLAGTLQQLPDDIEDPREEIIDFCFNKILKEDILNRIDNYAADLDKGIVKPLPTHKTQVEGHVGFIKRITPLFNEAVRREIDAMRSSAHMDNRTISFMEQAHDFVSTELIDYRPYCTYLTKTMLETIARYAGSPHMGHVEKMTLSLMSSYISSAFVSMLLEAPDYTVGGIRTMLKDCCRDMENLKNNLDSAFDVPEDHRAEFAAFATDVFDKFSDDCAFFDEQLAAMQDRPLPAPALTL